MKHLTWRIKEPVSDCFSKTSFRDHGLKTIGAKQDCRMSRTKGHYLPVREVPLLWEVSLQGLMPKINPPKSLEHYRWPHETGGTIWEIGSCLTLKKLTHDYSAPSPLHVTIICQEFLLWSSKIRTCCLLKEIFITSLHRGFSVILK